MRISSETFSSLSMAPTLVLCYYSIATHKQTHLFLVIKLFIYLCLLDGMMHKNMLEPGCERSCVDDSHMIMIIMMKKMMMILLKDLDLFSESVEVCQPNSLAICKIQYSMLDLCWLII